VFGDEPLQHQESIDTLWAFAKNAGYSEREIFEVTAHFEWESLQQSLNNPSLFSEKRLIECRLMEGKIGKVGAEFILKLIEKPLPQDIILLFSAQKIDTKIQKSPWFTALERSCCMVWARSLSASETLTWLKYKFSSAGLKAKSEDLQLLFERTEGNLLASALAIEKLVLYKGDKFLTREDILKVVGMDARFSVFDLVDAALSGSVERTSRVFSSLKSEGVDPILIVWAIAREVRTSLLILTKMQSGHLQPNVLNELGVWKRREPLMKSFIARFTIFKLQQILLRMKAIDEIIKGRIKGNAWSELLLICLSLAGGLP
jgi:DNA polymerase-3 subunit delta